ncbi:flavin reductase family protein [Streptomyces sp. NPDC047000]|uniref:flavin reductase family protein n=1 Tax=Streptomyces sp. NPDC047000 TaxID=3155474 RepID=UPI0033E40B8E
MADVGAFIDRLDPEMCVVTAVARGERAGCLVGFASQCSMRPVRYVVWLSRLNRTYRVARSADFLAVHLLDRDRRALAALFGGRTGDRADKFERLRLREGYGGAVVLADATAWFVGRTGQHLDGGDHVGFVLDPVQWGTRDGTVPLLRLTDCRGIAPGHPVD